MFFPSIFLPLKDLLLTVKSFADPKETFGTLGLTCWKLQPTQLQLLF
jgi:hypothetical protein